VSKTSLAADFDAAEPLRDERYERFAQLRVIGVPCRQAADDAGFRAKGGKEPLLSGNAARLDRHPEVRARKAYLAGDDAEVIAATRNFVRAKLMNWATLDVLAQYAIVGEVDIDDKKVTRIIGIDWAALKASEHSGAITKFKFDRETGVMTEFDRVDPDSAIAQLRDMYGLRAARRTELTGKDGGPIKHQDMSAYTDEELAQLEVIQTAAAARAIAHGDPGGAGTPRD
jgi:hypothetical protein